MSNNNVAFTICAKNYMAQALTLKESFEKYNSGIDFFIFLSDETANEDLPEVISLDYSWIPDWEKMAFKYDVIEFSTSIKPFCIDFLFSKGYEKVIYLDPDICVFSTLETIYDSLGCKSIILTPHHCELIEDDNSPIADNVVSNVGIYNLGFIAIKNNTIGQSVVNWWKERLSSSCYISYEEGLFVDQKWMDFIPGFFPEEVLISKHLGLNVALWNIQERMVYKKNDTYYVKSIINQEREDKLLFYHFSGFNPETPHLIDKRNDKYTSVQYPEMKELLEYYAKREFANGYKKYRKMKYSFNDFSDGTPILSIHRRMYRINEDKLSEFVNLFAAGGDMYNLLKRNYLLSDIRNCGFNNIKKSNNSKLRTNIDRLMLFLLRVLGINKYSKFLKFCKYVGRVENINYLYKI